MRVTGEIRIGEGSAYGSRATAPITNAPWPLLITAAASAFGGVMAVAFGEFLRAIGAFPNTLVIPATVIAGVVSIWFSIRLCRGVTVRNFRRSLLSRGISDPIATSFEVTPQGLICVSDGMEYRADWRAVTDVLRVGPYWVALAQAQPLMLPRRFFADHAAERAFITAMLERLEPAARARSGDALRFVDAKTSRS